MGANVLKIIIIYNIKAIIDSLFSDWANYNRK